ncbi:hypothetical protein DL96DRAFT_1556826 [Flagelloscypha sp. PMI_526]|nr:hypothetical protein DL96DRAFT_1556826 [Flagelloscypha sp. PMI_526]
MVTTTTSQARTEDNPLELADLSTSSPPLWKFPRPDSRTFQHVRDWILLLCIACQIRFGIVLSVALLMGIAMRTGRGILVTVTSAPSHDHPVTFEEFNAFIAASFLFSSSLVLILVPRFWGIVYEQPTLRWAGMVFAFGILCSAGWWDSDILY